MEKYKVPSNCEAMCPPAVNEEISADLNKVRRVQSTDKSFKDIQSLVTAELLPVLALTKAVKPFISQVPEVKTYISEILTIFGQVQFNLSLRRRYLMKPFVKSQLSALCNMKTPISTYLFGDDLQKEIKKCETAVKIGKFTPTYRRNFSVGRANPRFNKPFYQGQSIGPIRGRGRAGSRLRPYNNSWNQSTIGYGGKYGQFGHHAKRKNQNAMATSSGPTATVTQTSLN